MPSINQTRWINAFAVGEILNKRVIVLIGNFQNEPPRYVEVLGMLPKSEKERALAKHSIVYKTCNGETHIEKIEHVTRSGGSLITECKKRINLKIQLYILLKEPEPVAEQEPEPVAEQEPEPVVEQEPEPVPVRRTLPPTPAPKQLRNGPDIYGVNWVEFLSQKYNSYYWGNGTDVTWQLPIGWTPPLNSICN